MEHAPALEAIARTTVLTLQEVQARYANVTDDKERLYVLADFLDAVDRKETVLAGMEWNFMYRIRPRRFWPSVSLSCGHGIPECGAMGCGIGYGKLLYRGWDAAEAMKQLRGGGAMLDVFYAGDLKNPPSPAVVPTPVMVATRIREALAG